MLLRDRRDRIVLQRDPVPPPGAHAPATFVCPACDVVLWDGVSYSWCPVCDLPVDWVDLSIPVWCCPTCDTMINERRDDVPRCPPCGTPLVRIEAMEHPPADDIPKPALPASPGRVRRVVESLLEKVIAGVLLLCLIGPLLSLAVDPHWRLLALAFALPVFLIPPTLAGVFLWSLGSSLRELRDLARDRKTRVIHGLEHAAIRVLLDDGHIVYGGLTHPAFFEVHLYNEGKAEKQASVVRKAVTTAIRRVRDGERRLAYDHRCGTSMLVSVLLVALMAVASTVVGFFYHLSPLVLLIIGAAFVGTTLIAARPLGLLAQLLLTVSASFRSARVLRIVRTLPAGGERVCFDVYLHVRL